jgi:hypothetical protein
MLKRCAKARAAGKRPAPKSSQLTSTSPQSSRASARCPNEIFIHRWFIFGPPASFGEAMMSKRNTSGGWTGLILAALCLVIVGYVFHASTAQGSQTLFIADSHVAGAR